MGDNSPSKTETKSRSQDFRSYLGNRYPSSLPYEETEAQRRCCWFKITEEQRKAGVDRAQARLSNSSPEPSASKQGMPTGPTSRFPSLSSVSRALENEGSQALPSKQKPWVYLHGFGCAILALAILSWRNVSIFLHPFRPKGTLPSMNVFLDP